MGFHLNSQVLHFLYQAVENSIEWGRRFPAFIITGTTPKQAQWYQQPENSLSQQGVRKFDPVTTSAAIESIKVHPSKDKQGLILYQDGTTRGVSFIPAELVMTRTTATIWNIGSRTSLIKSSWYSRGQALSKILFPFMKLEAVVPLLPSTWCSLFHAIRRAKRVSLLMSMNSRGCRVNLPIPTAM